MYERIASILETNYYKKTDVYVCPFYVLDKIETLLRESNVEFISQLAEWPDMTGGAATVAWVDETGLNMIGWDYTL